MDLSSPILASILLRQLPVVGRSCVVQVLFPMTYLSDTFIFPF